MLVLDQLHQLRRSPLVLAQPQVEGLFQFPGSLPEFSQADHAAAAFQGMGVATNGGERLDIVRIGLQYRQLFAHGVQYLVGFFEEDGKQFRVDLFVRSLGQLLGFSGRLRDFRLLRLEGGKGGVDLFRPHIAGLQGFECGLGALSEFMVSDQIGILLDGLEVLLEFFLQALVLRCFLKGFDQRLGIARLTGQFALDTECRLLGGQFFLGCRFQILALQAGNKGIEIGFTAG